MTAKLPSAVAILVALAMTPHAKAVEPSNLSASDTTLAAANSANPPGEFDRGPDNPPPDPPDAARERPRGKRGEGRRFRQDDRGRQRGPGDGHRLEAAIMTAVIEVVGDIGPEREAELKSRIHNIVQEARRRHRDHAAGEQRGFGRRGRRGEVPGAGPLGAGGPPQEVFRDAPPGPPPPPPDAEARPREDRPRRDREGRRFQRFFNRFDGNGDGAVTRDEFTGRPERFDRIDLNGDGRIEPEEFADAIQAAQEIRRDRRGENRPDDAPPPRRGSADRGI